MSEQVMISRELLKRLCERKSAESIDDEYIARKELRELLAAPVSPQPDDEDEYMPAGIVEGIMRSGTVDAVSMAAQSLRAQPAGEVPEWAVSFDAFIDRVGCIHPVNGGSMPKAKKLFGEIQSIVAALQARAVVLPERLDIPHRDEFESNDQYAAAIGESKKWNACLDEIARLNGIKK